MAVYELKFITVIHLVLIINNVAEQCKVLASPFTYKLEPSRADNLAVGPECYNAPPDVVQWDDARNELSQDFQHPNPSITLLSPPKYNYYQVDQPEETFNQEKTRYSGPDNLNGGNLQESRSSDYAYRPQQHLPPREPAVDNSGMAHVNTWPSNDYMEEYGHKRALERKLTKFKEHFRAFYAGAQVAHTLGKLYRKKTSYIDAAKELLTRIPYQLLSYRPSRLAGKTKKN